MKALKTHICTTFLDTLIPCATFVKDKTIRVGIVITVLTVLRVWLPLYTMGKNFSNVSALVDWIKLRCSQSRNREISPTT